MRKNNHKRIRCTCGWEGKEDAIITKDVKGGGLKDVCPRCENEKASFEAVRELKTVIKKKKRIYTKRR